tara:strand:- start:51 stop:461 length:411 start_codon:yes stop_codon:yes gene_type:complete
MLVNKKDFIPLEQALDLKYLGYDEKSFGYFSDSNFIHAPVIMGKLYPISSNKIKTNECLSPLYQEAFRWLRLKWGYNSWVEQTGNINNYLYNYKIYGNGVYHRPIHTPSNYPYCKSYEEAELELLKELIIIVKEIE